MPDRSRILILILVLSSVLIGCGDDDPAAPPEAPRALAQLHMQDGGGSAIRAGTMTVAFSMGVDTYDEATLYEFSVSNDDQDSTVVIDAQNSPGFADVVAILTNGTDDFTRTSQELPGGGGGSRGRQESNLILGGVTGEYEPDLAGAEITHALLHMDVVSLDVPGSDPNGDGNWTDYIFASRLVIMGRP